MRLYTFLVTNLYTHVRKECHINESGNQLLNQNCKNIYQLKYGNSAYLLTRLTMR